VPDKRFSPLFDEQELSCFHHPEASQSSWEGVLIGRTTIQRREFLITTITNRERNGPLQHASCDSDQRSG
jgi:hypothetical protein